jgi:hypothetical protein
VKWWVFEGPEQPGPGAKVHRRLSVAFILMAIAAELLPAYTQNHLFKAAETCYTPKLCFGLR